MEEKNKEELVRMFVKVPKSKRELIYNVVAKSSYNNASELIIFFLLSNPSHFNKSFSYEKPVMFHRLPLFYPGNCNISMLSNPSPEIFHFQV